MALALLARDYCAARGGTVLALIVDHGLRPDSAQEARLTEARLSQQGISGRILTLRLTPGAALQARARTARYQALAQAAYQAGFTYLALGHHQTDQFETVAMRAAHGPGGAEGMPSWSARAQIVLLRPLLAVPPADLRAFLQVRGVAWVEDPSNQRRCFERVRVRQDQAGRPPVDAAARVTREEQDAAFLARYTMLSPHGYAVVAADTMPASVLGSLIRTLGGRLYAPRQVGLLRLAARLLPATLGGVRITPAGRLGPGWLLAREPASCAVPVLAQNGVLWDSRFTLLNAVSGAVSLGALGAQASQFRGYEGLPSLVLQALPALRDAQGTVIFPANVRFTPPLPLAPRPFQAAIYA